MKYDVVIIGAGLGGLACGSILARHGRRVLVLEQGAVPGGCLQSYHRRDLTFDTGFHYVGGLDEGQSMHAVFKYLGLLDLPWQRLDARGFDRVTIGHRTYALAEGYEEFAHTLADSFPQDREALYRYTELLRQANLHQFDALNPHGTVHDVTAEWMQQSAWDYLEENFRTPLLRDVLCGPSIKMELRKESLPLFTFLHGQSGYVESSWRLRGAGSQIADRLVADIKAQGGKVICRSRVTELMEENGRLTTAVCSDGERYKGELFISDIHPATTCDLVSQSTCIRPLYRRRMAGLENTFGMFTVSLRLRPHSLRYFNHNKYVYREPGLWNFWEKYGPVSGVLISCRPPEDGSDYLSQIDLLTPVCWDRFKDWTHTHVGRRDNAYKALKDRLTMECLGLAEHVLPGLAAKARAISSSPLTWRDYTLTPEGSAYGVRKDFRAPLTTMLSPRTPIPNLLLTGQSLMLHGVQGVTMTAFHTCAEVVGKEAIWHIVGHH
jgi:all-trans-retinol 13,14-reductase